MRISKRLLALLLFIATCYAGVMAQALNYDNNRIAVSADGNNQADNHDEANYPRGDPDDWGGTPTAFAILAKAGLQAQLVHYSYNNFIEAPAHTTETNQMKVAADYAIENWGFDATKNGIIDASEDNAAAVSHLANEIGKSSEADPLYYLNMGPSELFYRAVQEAIDNGNEESLSFVYIISHSGYNDNHQRRLNHHTMDDAIALSGDKLKYNKIKDQNSKTNPDAGFSSDKDYTVWYWMRDHYDEGIQFIYDRMFLSKKADCSDAGMLYYLLNDDENGSPSKLQAFFGTGIMGDATPAACADVEYNGADDFDFTQVEGFVPCYQDTKWPSQRYCVGINAGAYKDEFGAVTKVFEGQSGTYNITLNTLLELDGECTYRLKIDNELIGEFQNISATKDYEKHSHTFEDVAVTTGSLIQVESNTHSNGLVLENDDEPGIFAYARGRWESMYLECLGATPCDSTIEEKDGLLVFEAERIQLTGSWKLGTDESYASGGKYIYFDGANNYSGTPKESEILTHTFTINTPGVYAYRWFVRQDEENRGKATGKQGTDLSNDVYLYFPGGIGSFKGETLTSPVKFYGRSDPGFWLYGIVEHNHESGEMTLTFDEPGEYTVEIGGRSHGYQIDKVVIAKKSEYNLWDYSKQTEATMGKTWPETSECASLVVVPPTEPAVEESLKFIEAPAVVSNTATEITASFEYTLDESRKVFLAVYGPEENFIKNISATVAEGSGTSSLTVVLDESLPEGENYTFRLFLRPLGGDWQSNYATVEQSFNVESTIGILDEIQNQGTLKVYPNPAVNELTISSDVDNINNADITIYSLSGEMIKQIDSTTLINNKNVRISLDGLTKGTYIVHLKTSQLSSNAYFVKQ